MRRIKALLLTAVFVFLGTSAFAADATVTFVSGKVEVQRGGKWVALQKGDTVAKSETISTGFQSEAKIKILDSVMYLGPVTRITLEELSSTSQKDNVSVYLKTGTARSQVKHVDNKRVNYQVHTAVAVASCRGTGWIIDDSNNIDCYEGVVAVSAYEEPVIEIAQAESDEEESEDSEESKESKEGESAAGEEVAAADGGAASGDDTSSGDDTLTSDDGILLQANQSVTVSENSSVSAPVSNVEKTANDVVGIITTAANKESEGGAGLGAGNVINAISGGNSSNGAVTATASVVVIIELPDAF